MQYLSHTVACILQIGRTHYIYMYMYVQFTNRKNPLYMYICTYVQFTNRKNPQYTCTCILQIGSSNPNPKWRYWGNIFEPRVCWN